MLRYGITGGIGSGKSTIAKAFACLGVPLYNADLKARELMNSNQRIREFLSGEFGEDSYVDGKLNRNYLAQIVFQDKEKLERLNKIVHPEVAQDFKTWSKKKENEGHKMILKEAALLIETGSYKELDFLILVLAPLEERISRVQERDGSSREDIVNRIGKQLSDEEKIAFADLILKNDNQEPILEKVIEIVKEAQIKNAPRK